MSRWWYLFRSAFLFPVDSGSAGADITDSFFTEPVESIASMALSPDGNYLPEEFDAGPLVELIGPLPYTPVREGVAATGALFRERVESGDSAADALH